VNPDPCSADGRDVAAGRRGRRRRGVLAGLLILAAGLLPGVGVRAAPDEAAVQAAFVLNFARFTEWPTAYQPARAGALQVCQYGVRDELTQALRALEGRAIQGAPLAWRRVARADDLRGCHVLVMAEPGLAAPGLAGQPVLTVSDLPAFAAQGGVIGLVRHGGRMRFEIHRGAAVQAGLRISTELLALAMTVIEPGARREGPP
jgi:hypothetical protein